MRKISLILSAAALSLLNSGARAATDDFGAWVTQPLLTPHPAMVAILALVGMGFLVLLARTPIGTTPAMHPTATPWKWPRLHRVGLPVLGLSQRNTFALLAMIAVSGSLGMA
jgi:hypothetical protein